MADLLVNTVDLAILKRRENVDGYNRKMHSCSRANYNKMTELGNDLMKLKGSPENDQIPFREKFHLLEDE